MPNKAAHIAAARRNQVTLDFLLAGPDEHLPWVVTVAFYKALHIVEAVFAGSQHGPHHTDDHKARNKVLKSTNRYQQLWRMYRPLWDASLNARYLRENENAPTYEVFSAYLPREAVTTRLLGHYLEQLQRSAGRLLGDPNFLDS